MLVKVGVAALLGLVFANGEAMNERDMQHLDDFQQGDDVVSVSSLSSDVDDDRRKMLFFGKYSGYYGSKSKYNYDYNSKYGARGESSSSDESKNKFSLFKKDSSSDGKKGFFGSKLFNKKDSSSSDGKFGKFGKKSGDDSSSSSSRNSGKLFKKGSRPSDGKFGKFGKFGKDSSSSDGKLFSKGRDSSSSSDGKFGKFGKFGKKSGDDSSSSRNNGKLFKKGSSSSDGKFGKFGKFGKDSSSSDGKLFSKKGRDSSSSSDGKFGKFGKFGKDGSSSSSDDGKKGLFGKFFKKGGKGSLSSSSSSSSDRNGPKPRPRPRPRPTPRPTPKPTEKPTISDDTDDDDCDIKIYLDSTWSRYDYDSGDFYDYSGSYHLVDEYKNGKNVFFRRDDHSFVLKIEKFENENYLVLGDPYDKIGQSKIYYYLDTLQWNKYENPVTTHKSDNSVEWNCMKKEDDDYYYKSKKHSKHSKHKKSKHSKHKKSKLLKSSNQGECKVSTGYFNVLDCNDENCDFCDWDNKLSLFPKFLTCQFPNTNCGLLNRVMGRCH